MFWSGPCSCSQPWQALLQPTSAIAAMQCLQRSPSQAQAGQVTIDVPAISICFLPHRPAGKPGAQPWTLVSSASRKRKSPASCKACSSRAHLKLSQWGSRFACRWPLHGTI